MPDFNAMFKDLAVDPDSAESRHLSVLLFGLAGSGKSSLAASASQVAEMSPVLFLDTERNGMDPVRRHGDTDKITVVPVTDYKTLQDVTKRLTKSPGDLPFKTVIIDTVDQLQEIIVKHWTTMAPNDGYAKWAAAYDELLNLFWPLHSAGINVIMTTHATISQDPVGEMLVAPSFAGKQSLTKLPSKVNLVGYMSKVDHDGKVIRVLQCEAPEGLIVKKPLGVPPKMGQPTFQKIWDFAFNTDTTTNPTK